MLATIYRFEEATWRNTARRDRPAEPLESDRFFWQLDRLLRRLGDLHLRISLARLPLPANRPGGDRLADGIADNLQDPCALAGVMPDGSIVAAFLGPRGNGGAIGDQEMTARIARRFERAVRGGKDGADISLGDLTVVHCWSDEIYDVSSLVLELATARQGRFGAQAMIERDGSRSAS